MPGNVRQRWATAAVLAAAVLAMHPSMPAIRAQEVPGPSAEKGLQLAQRLCSNCHLVEDRANATLPAGIPTFRAIANRRGQSGQRITNILLKPHEPMPDIRLTGPEIRDILAYLETLRTDPSVPPLSPKQGGKPDYPQPS